MAFKGKCEWCGAKNGAYEVNGKHIMRVQLATIYKDSNPRNRQPNNILLLCQDCSRRYDAEQNAAPQQQRLF